MSRWNLKCWKRNANTDVDKRLKFLKNLQIGECQAANFTGNAVAAKCSIFRLNKRKAKQQALFQRLQKLQTHAIDVQPMIIGNDKHYRRRAKLSIAIQQGKAVIGFRLQNSNQIIPLAHCEVLVEPLANLLPKLKHLIENWQQPKKLGHIELVSADNTIALFFRHLGALSAQDNHNLRQFATQEQLSLL